MPEPRDVEQCEFMHVHEDIVAQVEKNMPDEDKCGVFEIDHEILFSLDEETTERREVEAEMNPIAENFIAYLEALQSDEI